MDYYIDLSDRRNTYLKKFLENGGENVFEYIWNNKNVKDNDTIIFSPAKKFTLEDLGRLPNRIRLFAGKLSDEAISFIREKDISYINIMADEMFTINNAILTAEGVLALVLEKTEKSIFENNILILGAGRIGKATASLFGKLGLDFTMSTFNETEFFNSKYYVKKCFLKNEFEQRIGEFDVIINTRPFRYIQDNLLEKISPDTLFIETASVDCLDKEKAIHFNYLPAPALPQKYCCESAAKLMLKRIIGETK